MKKLLFFLLIGLFVTACSNDFDVTAPWKAIPVVYGILSPQDTAHYIRVEKAFVDPERSALEIAQIADSLYYPENAIAVWLERKLNGQRVQLHRVNGALEGYPRTGGVFATQPNWLYKVDAGGSFGLTAGETYRLVIERADGQVDVTAETTLPSDFRINKPKMSDQVPTISFEGTKATSINWDTDVNGVYFNVTFIVRYNERNLNGSLVSTHELVWEAAKNVERDNVAVSGKYQGNLLLSGTNFYNFLAQNLQRPAPNRYREFGNFDIIIDGGGKEIKEYLETAQANSGLTGAETFPNYTNVSEGYGIFTAKNRSIGTGIRVKSFTVDSMKVNSITDTLGFVN